MNVTLIFSVERYEKVMEAYLDGLDAAAQAGHDLSRIHSVASFFVSRVDTEIDKRLDAIGTPEATEAGLRILGLGGNAVDAAVAVSRTGTVAAFYPKPGEGAKYYRISNDGGRTWGEELDFPPAYVGPMTVGRR